MEFLIVSIFKFWCYVIFGFMLEIKFTALGGVADGKVTKEDKKLKGTISLWMIPVYGFLVWLLFEPLSGFIQDWPIYVRFGIWGILISSFEALSGWFYHKVLNIKPWDYSTSKFKVFKDGYTKWTLIPAWGIAGLILEHYSHFVVFMSKYVPEFFKGIL